MGANATVPNMAAEVWPDHDMPLADAAVWCALFVLAMGLLIFVASALPESILERKDEIIDSCPRWSYPVSITCGATIGPLGLWGYLQSGLSDEYPDAEWEDERFPSRFPETLFCLFIIAYFVKDVWLVNLDDFLIWLHHGVCGASTLAVLSYRPVASARFIFGTMIMEVSNTTYNYSRLHPFSQPINLVYLTTFSLGHIGVMYNASMMLWMSWGTVHQTVVLGLYAVTVVGVAVRQHQAFKKVNAAFQGKTK